MGEILHEENDSHHVTDGGDKLKQRFNQLSSKKKRWIKPIKG